MIETDLYALTMAASYFQHGKHEETATFEGFVRKLPANRNFLVFAGLKPLLKMLKEWKLKDEHLVYLKGLPQFENMGEDFWYYLRNLRFTCKIKAMREGTLFFADEPFIQITGPLIQAQLVETLILSVLNYSIAVASKAARIRIAAGDDASLSEFGFRRAAGPDAANLASYAAWVGGFNYTSNVQAAHDYGIPLTGTMAHSYVMTHNTEKEAFKNYHASFEKGTVLIDTYEPIQGVRNAAEEFGKDLIAVRLDSGDKIKLSRDIRYILDYYYNLQQTKIIVSDDMNEYKIQSCRLNEAPIDGYGIGTELVNPGPIGGVYKLVEHKPKGMETQLKAKLSSGKATYPGAKQIYRVQENGSMTENPIYTKDLIVFNHEKHLCPGIKLLEVPDGSVSRFKVKHFELPKKFLSLDEVYTYDVQFSKDLKICMTELMRRNNK